MFLHATKWKKKPDVNSWVSSAKPGLNKQFTKTKAKQKQQQKSYISCAGRIFSENNSGVLKNGRGSAKQRFQFVFIQTS